MKELKSKRGRYISRVPGVPEESKWMEITSRIYNGCDCYPWMEVFAWWPVKTIGGKRVWLRKIYKRKFWAVWGNGFHMEPEVEYGELFDILKNEVQ